MCWILGYAKEMKAVLNASRCVHGHYEIEALKSWAVESIVQNKY